MKKILIVDDHPLARELVCATFEGESHLILMAENGEQGLALARAELPDIVLLDIQMPGRLDGLQVCRLLKGEAQTRGIYVMMLTAKGQEWDEQLGYEAGADDYVVKPFSPLALLTKVEAVLATNPINDTPPLNSEVDQSQRRPVPITFEIDGQPFTVPLAESLVIGRSDSRSPDAQPDLDLSPFAADEHGVSRRHAQIRCSGDLISVADLGSSNGTWLNGERLICRREYQLHHGDELQLGLLKLRLGYGWSDRKQ